MMMSVDGRIDCAMTAKLDGVEEYYETLNALHVPTTLSGKTTALLEMADGSFISNNDKSFGKEGFSKKMEANGYEVVVDTKGTLLWQDQTDNEKPLLIITSQKVTTEYLEYLDSKNISWIVCGEEKIDLSRAVEILAKEFNVERMGIVGGGTINAGFLSAGLLDEVSILLAPGIDARKGMTSTFDGLPMNAKPFHLKLENVKKYGDGALWILYSKK